MPSHEERLAIIESLVSLCHDKGWTFDTKALADRLEPHLHAQGYTKATVHSYVGAVVFRLREEKIKAEKSKVAKASIVTH